MSSGLQIGDPGVINAFNNYTYQNTEIVKDREGRNSTKAKNR
jgi:hypothetical protein